MYILQLIVVTTVAVQSGERNANALATLINHRVKKTKGEIIRSLTEEWKEEYLFEMQLNYELYAIIQLKTAACDSRIEQLLTESMQQRINALNIKPEELHFVT